MRIPFIIASGVLMLLIAYVYPFVAVLRGKPIRQSIVHSYGILVLYMFCLCMLVPGIVYLFDEQLSREMLTDWVPEAPGVIATMVIGWLPASVAVLVALPVRWFLRKFWPRTFNRADIPSQTSM